MKEKFPQPKIENRESSRQERVALLGNQALEGEAEFKIPIHRRRGFMLVTFMAMGLTLFGGRAEAQFRIGYGGMGTDIRRNVVAGAQNAWEMHQNRKILKIHDEHEIQMRELIRVDGELYKEYHRQMLELREQQDREGLRRLEEEYRKEKSKLERAKRELNRRRDARLMSVRGVRDGVRGGVGILGR